MGKTKKVGTTGTTSRRALTRATRAKLGASGAALKELVKGIARAATELHAPVEASKVCERVLGRAGAFNFGSSIGLLSGVLGVDKTKQILCDMVDGVATIGRAIIGEA